MNCPAHSLRSTNIFEIDRRYRVAFHMDPEFLLKTWMMFLTFGPENLGYLSGTPNNTLEIHTMPIYFPLFRSVTEDLPVKYIELDSETRNIHLVAVVNLTSILFSGEPTRFTVIWKQDKESQLESKARLYEFYANSFGDLEFIQGTEEKENQVYFSLKRARSPLLYLTVDQPVRANSLGDQTFLLKGSNNSIIAQSPMVKIKLKHASLSLPHSEVVCNGQEDYCTILRMPGNTLICQREAILLSMTESMKAKFEHRIPPWIIYCLLTFAFLAIVVLIVMFTLKLRTRMISRASFPLDITQR
ncbi:hypothetical protein CSKR_200150 [Clonorchis sinensis]|uniref:Uncharacterized protein n=1 Tax=Clonorchis sinensis TaxID=79923 RepID=A0A8T1M027_CLOSI|nr:hypothetical protein CSKR_200150 [Clonorchis sinensis]